MTDGGNEPDNGSVDHKGRRYSRFLLWTTQYINYKVIG